MNFKKRHLIMTALILVGIAILVVIIKLSNFNEQGNTSIDKPIFQTIDPKSDTLYGAIQMPFPNFSITPDIKIEDYPVVFNKDGKVGYKDKNGKIIVEPIYSMAHQYWNGVGRVRIDNKNGSFTWKTVSINGEIYDYDEVYGFFNGLSPVLKDGKYGFINYDGELIVPLNYDKLFNAYTDNARSSYAIREGEFVYLNFEDGCEEVFEKYDPNKKLEYKRTLDLKDYNLTVSNNMLIVNGQSDPNGVYFPLTILQGLDFTLYTQNEKLGTYQAKLTEGNFEGEVFISFPEYNRPLIDDIYQEYYAVLSSANIEYQNVTKVESTERFAETVKRYLKDNKIENTSISVGLALEGDFTGSGATGVVLEIHDNYRNDRNSKPFMENWSEEQFAKSKTALVNTILINDDLNKPLEFRIIKSNTWTHLDETKYRSENIGFIANLDADKELELLISNGYYEYRDYSIVDLN